MAGEVFRILSLFSGAGGLDLGFVGGFEYLGRHYPANGFRVVAAYDSNPAAVATYNANLEPVCRLADLASLPEEALPQAEVVLGGFPCQDFSLAGRRQGIATPRGRLYLAMVRAVARVRPLVFVAENVRGLLSANGGAALEAMVEDFASAGPGYRLQMALLDAADYGVPQRRERLFLVGTRSDLPQGFAFPEPTHADPRRGLLLLLGRSPWVTAQEALSDLEDERRLASLPNPEYSRATRNAGQGNEPLHSHRPAPTVRAEHHGNIQFHYRLPRRLSVREVARLQSFPDAFRFAASMSEAYRLVGNAVPPLLAWHLGRAVRDYLESAKREGRGRLAATL